MPLSWTDIACLTAFPCVISGAQVLLRATAAHAQGKPMKAALPIYLRQPTFYAALVVFAAATLLWLGLLSRYTLALAYPFTTLAFLIVPLLERLFFGVRTNLLYWAGLALIVTGALWISQARVG